MTYPGIFKIAHPVQYPVSSTPLPAPPDNNQTPLSPGLQSIAQTPAGAAPGTPATGEIDPATGLPKEPAPPVNTTGNIATENYPTGTALAGSAGATGAAHDKATSDKPWYQGTWDWMKQNPGTSIGGGLGLLGLGALGAGKGGMGGWLGGLGTLALGLGGGYLWDQLGGWGGIKKFGDGGFGRAWDARGKYNQFAEENPNILAAVKGNPTLSKFVPSSDQGLLGQAKNFVNRPLGEQEILSKGDIYKNLRTIGGYAKDAEGNVIHDPSRAADNLSYLTTLKKRLEDNPTMASLVGVDPSQLPKVGLAGLANPDNLALAKHVLDNRESIDAAQDAGEGWIGGVHGTLKHLPTWAGKDYLANAYHKWVKPGLRGEGWW